MKVLCNTYGYLNDVRFLKAIKDMSEFEWRTNSDIIKLVEKKHCEINYLKNLKKLGIASKGQLSKLDKLTDDLNCKCWEHFCITEVDTSRPWVFSEYDTSIRVIYLEEKNEEFNFYGFV